MTVDADAAVLALFQPATDTDSALDVKVTIPTATAVALKHRTAGALDIAETLSLIAQLYAAAPLEPGAGSRVLTKDQFNKLAETLGFTPH